MQAYRVASGRRIAPFGDPVAELHVATRTIRDWQALACRAAGLELSDVADPSQATARPAVLFFDDVFFTEMALRNFLAAVIHQKEDAALGMPDSAGLRAVAPYIDTREGPEEGSRAFDVFFLAGAGEAGTRESLRARAKPVLQEKLERTILVRLPPAAGGRDSIEAPFTARVVAHVRHWVHLLRLSHLVIGTMLVERLRDDPWRMLSVRLSRRQGPWAAARKMVFVDPTARVHPTADLEAAIVGPRCVVRAHAHVHQSVLGEGVEIGDHAVVMGSTLADRVQVLRASYLAGCAAMPGGTLGNYKVQLSLFGREVFLTTSAWLLDAKLRGEVKVEHEGALIPAGSSFLGSCLGHRVTLGAQVAIEPGRAVPNDSLILGPQHGVARTFHAEPAGTVLTIRDGEVVPLGK